MSKMQDLLSHPAFQAAIAPLVVSLVVALGLSRANDPWPGLAVLAGIFVAVLLIKGIQFQPLTSDRKIILCSLFLPFLALFCGRAKCSRIRRLLSVSTILGCAALWVAWPVLANLGGAELLAAGTRVALFAAVIGVGMSWLERFDMPRQGGAMLSLGIGVGASSILAASAWYGQLAFAVSAAVGGLLLVYLLGPMISKAYSIRSGSNLGILSLMAVAVPLGLIGGAATIYAKLPVAALFCLALIPAVATIPVLRGHNPWLRTTMSTVFGLLAASPAIWLAWDTAGSMGY